MDRRAAGYVYEHLLVWVWAGKWYDHPALAGERIDLDTWRKRNPQKPKQGQGGPVQASKDGWTGD